MESYYDRLKELRSAARLSQQDMADALGITRAGYQMMESGSNGKKFAYLPIIAKTLGCRIDDLFPEMDEPKEEESVGEGKTVGADGFEDETMEGWAE